MGSSDDAKRSSDKASAGKVYGGVKGAKSGFVDAAALIEAELAKTSLPPAPTPYARHMPTAAAAAAMEVPAAHADGAQLQAPSKADPKVHMTNVNFGAGEMDVRKVFERFGTIRNVTMRFDSVKGHHKGFAIVEYENPDSARLVAGIPPNTIHFGGLAVRITPPSDPSNKPAATECPVIDLPVSRTPVHVGDGREAKKAVTLAQRIAATRGLRPAGPASAGPAAGGSARGMLDVPTPTAIVIANMVRSADEVDNTLVEEITHECGKFGRVLHVSFFASDETEGPNVAVEFASKEAAQGCSQKMHGRLFDGRPLRSSILSRDYYDQIRNA